METQDKFTKIKREVGVRSCHLIVVRYMYVFYLFCYSSGHVCSSTNQLSPLAVTVHCSYLNSRFRINGLSHLLRCVPGWSVGRDCTS